MDAFGVPPKNIHHLPTWEIRILERRFVGELAATGQGVAAIARRNGSVRTDE